MSLKWAFSTRVIASEMCLAIFNRHTTESIRFEGVPGQVCFELTYSAWGAGVYGTEGFAYSCLGSLAWLLEGVRQQTTHSVVIFPIS